MGCDNDGGTGGTRHREHNTLYIIYIHDYILCVYVYMYIMYICKDDGSLSGRSMYELE